MSALNTLCNVIAQRCIVSKASCKELEGFGKLIADGLLHDDYVVQSVFCDACDDPHDAEVVYDQGKYGHFCPNFGFVQLSRENLIGIRPDIGKLVESLAEVLDCKRRKASPIHGDTWRIGALDTQAGDLVLYFAPTLNDEMCAKGVAIALTQEMNAAFRLVLTANGTLTVSGSKTALLNEVFELTGEGHTLSLLVDLNLIVGAPSKIRNGRPSPYATKLTNLILTRIADNTARSGRNSEARAIDQLFRAKYSKDQPPSLPTIQRHITKHRTGSKLDQN